MSNPFGSTNKAQTTTGTTPSRSAIHEKPLSAFISSVPEELCGATAEFNPFQFWNVDGEEIDKWSLQINDAISTAVNRHHRGFNQATTEFDEILSAFHDSEIKFKRLISNLLEARKLLHQSRGSNGKTASIAKQWKSFENYKKKLKELDKIEYILEIPQIFEKYLTKKQFIHATVLLEDGLSLYATSLTQDSYQQLQGTQQSILNKKNDLEKLLRQQLYQQIYFKTNSLRSNLLHPPKRKVNKNILNLLNLQKEIMLMEEDKKQQQNNKLLSTKPHYKGTKSVHYDTLASLNQRTESIGIGASIKGKKHKYKTNISSNQSTSLQDPYKIIIPTYKSFRNLDDIKGDDNMSHANVQHLLVAETTDEYLNLANNNNNYLDDEQPLFLTICVTAIDKLGRSVGAKTNLYKSLDIELKEIIDREIYEICNNYQQQMIQSNQMTNIIEAEDQSLLLLNATANVFKIFSKVLCNHKTVINVFNSRGRRNEQYNLQSIWNGIQKAILNNLLIKYLDQMQDQKNRDRERDSVVDILLNDNETKMYQDDDNILHVRSPSPSPTPNIKENKTDNKSFGKRLKTSKFFKRRRNTNTTNTTNTSTSGGGGHGGDVKERNDDNTDGDSDLFASSISNKYHDMAMDGLTFSFADSNIHSFVHKAMGMATGKGQHKAMPSAFAASGHAPKRLSLSQANAFNINTGTHSASGIMQLGMPSVKARDRSATGLDAFSQGAKSRQKRTMTIAAAMGANKRMSNAQKMAPKLTGMSSKAKRRKQLSLIESSPYHVTKLYKPIIHFVEMCEWKILGDKIKIDKDVDLREFLLSFVKKTFIPNMQGEAYSQMGQILLDNQPMDAIKLHCEPLLLLKSTSGIFDLVKTLFEYYIVLPVFDNNEFINMIHVILSKVCDTYQQAIDEICEILISKELIYNNNNKKYVQQLSTWNLSKLYLNKLSLLKEDNMESVYVRKYDKKAYEINENESKDVDKSSYEYICNKYEDIALINFLNLGNDKIDKNDINMVNGLPAFNTEYFNKLALISRGLYWCSKKISSELINNRKNKKNKAELIKITEYLRVNFEPRSERCISIIRMEMRAQIVCLLANISLNNYWMPNDSIINKPQDFIITLNKLLQSAEGKLSGCLPNKFIRFLFVELAYFICNIIIYQIPLVKSGRINHVGYKQLYKNTFSLQQNLTTITQKGMEKCFDRAQKYLKLSQKTPQDIQKIQDIKNKKYGQDKEKYAAYNFTKDQYDAISTVAKLSNAHRK